MKREEQIFQQALALTSAEAQDAYALGACGGDQNLLRRIRALLAAHQNAGAIRFLSSRARTTEETLSAEPAGERPGTRVGHYKLLQEIGEGGCGVVYMAEQEEPLRRRVALKVIKLGMDTRQVIAGFEAGRHALALA